MKLNEGFEVIYPTGTFDQLKEKGCVNLESSDIFKTKTTFIEKEAFLEFSNSNKLHLNSIRNGNLKIGITEKQCRFSWETHLDYIINIV
ncbi:hypothetical protein OAB20_00310 [Winogradskyella sp.]|nr:hypothetical protein [Winogradskyella sp.]